MSALDEDDRQKLQRLTNLVFWQWYNLSSAVRAVMQLSLVIRAIEDGDRAALQNGRERLDRIVAALNEELDRMDRALDQIPNFSDARPE